MAFFRFHHLVDQYKFANKGGDGALEVAIVRKESRMRISLDSYVVIGVISVIIRLLQRINHPIKVSGTFCPSESVRHSHSVVVHEVLGIFGYLFS